MAIKWGNTYVTAVKWGNTVCSQVKWGSTVVFPGGGYDGSSFGPPLTGGIKYSVNGGANYTNVTSGAISFTSYKYFTKDTVQYVIRSINENNNFSSFTKFKMTFSLSTTNSAVSGSASSAVIYEQGDSTRARISTGIISSGTEYSFTTTISSGYFQCLIYFSSERIVESNNTVAISKIEFY